MFTIISNTIHPTPLQQVVINRACFANQPGIEISSSELYRMVMEKFPQQEEDETMTIDLETGVIDFIYKPANAAEWSHVMISKT